MFQFPFAFLVSGIWNLELKSNPKLHMITHMSAEKEDLWPRNRKPNVCHFSLFWLPFVFTFWVCLGGSEDLLPLSICSFLRFSVDGREIKLLSFLLEMPLPQPLLLLICVKF